MFTSDQLQTWSGGKWVPSPPEKPLCRIVHDTRNICPGDLFAAVKGDRFDGHHFISEAQERGAVAVLSEKETEFHIPHLLVENTRKSLWKMAENYRATWRAKVVGITGSVGKTSVKNMLFELFSAIGITGCTIGNWNNALGVPLSILSVRKDVEFAVLEVGMNHPGELEPLCKLIKPDVGVITNVGLAHSEFFDSEKSIAMEKSQLLKALQPDGFAVLDADSPWFSFFKEACPADIVKTSFSSDADYIGSAMGHALEVFERETGLKFLYRMPVPGRFVMHNALSVIALGRTWGMNACTIYKKLLSFRPSDMRWEEKKLKDRIWINDAYNASPSSMKASLLAFNEFPCRGQKWLVLGDMLELGTLEEEAHEEIGRLVSKGPWAGLITVGKFARNISEMAREKGMVQAEHMTDLPTVSTKLSRCTSPGDSILIKASRATQLERLMDYFNPTNS